MVFKELQAPVSLPSVLHWGLADCFEKDTFSHSSRHQLMAHGSAVWPGATREQETEVMVQKEKPKV